MAPNGARRHGGRPSLLAVWDFDGTLADTFAAIRAAADRALAGHGLPAADVTLLRSLVGRNLSHIFDRLTGGDDARLVAALTEAYYREFAETGPAHTTLFPGIDDLLEELGRHDVASAIATSKSRVGVALMLERLGVAGLFDPVISDDDVVEKKPLPEMVFRACEHHGVEPDDAVVIGDTIFDVEMGHAAGAATIAVTWGNHDRELLRQARPTHLVDDVRQLADALDARRQTSRRHDET
jgi:phosphoglycolate phosphatase